MDLFQNLEIINSKVERVKDNATTCKKVKLELDTLLIILFSCHSPLSLIILTFFILTRSKDT